MNTHYGSEEIAVRVEGLVKRFGEKAAVDHVDFAVRAGSVFGLLGPNGAGKTTIVRMLSTLTRPDGGTATVAGLDVVKHAQAVRRVIGLTGQFAAVDETLSGYENIYMIGRLLDMPAKQAKRRAGELLAAFDLAEDAKKPAKQYSGGMRRRLDLAASLVGRPAVLFLDEPTTGLDPARRNDLWEIVRDLSSTGTTVLLTFGLAEDARKPAKQYSGGMRRRLDLAASLVGRPKVLFLDEPTTGLDPARRNDLWEIVRDLSQGGTTVLLTTQYMEEAEALAHDIAVMDQGRFIARGTADELKVRIAGRTIRLRPLAEADLPALREVLQEVLGSVQDSGPNQLSGPIADDEKVAALLSAVAAKDIAIADISTVTASLDEVFLELTEKRGGKEAEPATGSERPAASAAASRNTSTSTPTPTAGTTAASAALPAQAEPEKEVAR